MKRINKFYVWLLLIALPCAGAAGQVKVDTTSQVNVDSASPDRSYFSVGRALNEFYSRVITRKAATVGFLGGSITYNPGWRDKVCAWLQGRFPETKFRFIAAGIPSLGSLPHAFRVQRDLLDSGRVDLLFLETAVNDRVNGTDSLTQARALEGIVRHVKKVNPDVQVIIMAFADEDKTADYDRGVTPVEIINQERIADYYHLPSINLGREVWDKIKHGELDWKRDFKDVHPSEFGQELYFSTIRRLLDSCYRLYQAALRPVAAVRPGGTLPARHMTLPARLDRACFVDGRYVGVDQAAGDKGWTLDKDWAPGDSAQTRPGFVHVPVLAADKPGAELRFSFKGTAVGIAVLSGPDAGVIEYNIDGGAFKQLNLYTQWSSWIHLPWYLLLGSGLAGTKHELRIRINAGNDPKSKGQACRIVHFLVNG